MTPSALLEQHRSTLQHSIQLALQEDLNQQDDITGMLIPAHKTGQATIVTRDNMVLAGMPWAEEACRQVDPTVKLISHFDEGTEVAAGSIIATLEGCLRSILTAERTALNFIQLLSSTATTTREYLNAMGESTCELLDTRKTIPGLRFAQKYAVRCGGGRNHRFGLYDAYLIKENHIAACGSIAEAVQQARINHPNLPVEVETENLEELEQAIAAKADIVMLDNFSLDFLKLAVTLNQGRCQLEASGNVTLETIAEIARTGVNFISVGAITKNILAIDLSLRLSTEA